MNPKSNEPQHVSQALAELIALRGYARRDAAAQLREAWDGVAGPEIARHTKATGLNRGVLQVAVGSASLLGELTGFHKSSLLTRLRETHPDLRIRDVKFRLDSGLKR
jgi:predicted nucleic acid-binding Zn ribbon protein